MNRSEKPPLDVGSPCWVWAGDPDGWCRGIIRGWTGVNQYWDGDIDYEYGWRPGGGRKGFLEKYIRPISANPPPRYEEKG